MFLKALFGFHCRSFIPIRSIQDDIPPRQRGIFAPPKDGVYIVTSIDPSFSGISKAEALIFVPATEAFAWVTV